MAAPAGASRALIEPPNAVDAGRDARDRAALLSGHEVEEAGVAECIAGHRRHRRICACLHREKTLHQHSNPKSTMLAICTFRFILHERDALCMQAGCFD